MAVLPVEEQMSILTEFVKSSVPNWPGNLTLHQFVQHMTLDHVDLVRNRLLANHQVRLIRGLPYMTSAVGGGKGVPKKQTKGTKSDDLRK